MQNFNDIFSNLPPHAASESSAFPQMDHISPQDLSLSLDCLSSQLDLQHSSALSSDAASWINTSVEFSSSEPSSSYSGSPAQSDLGLPVVAPRPQHAPAAMTFDMWHDMAPSCAGKITSSHAQGESHPLSVVVAGVDAAGFDMLFDGGFAGMDF